jgi:hypothetical protein
MTKHADPGAKTLQLICRPKPGQEDKFRAFKEICVRNNLQVTDQLFIFGVEAFLRKHHWPPGNSQTLLAKFQAPVMAHCWFCKKPAEHQVRHRKSGKIYTACDYHRDQVKGSEKWEIVK